MKNITTGDWFLLGAMVLGFGMMGVAGGGGAAVSFAGLGLVIWVFWRGRKVFRK